MVTSNHHQAAQTRLPVIDLLKVMAAQLVVLHHLAWYGPLSHVADDRWPDLLAWFVDNGPLAVPVFLVIGGFLAARSLAWSGLFSSENPKYIIWQRYQRLIIPFAAALLLAISCAAMAAWVYPHDATPDVSHVLDLVWRFVMHLLLLHSVFGVDALTTGVWYVAIDFQLFAFMVLLLVFARTLKLRWGQTASDDWALRVVYVVLALSVWFFNRNPNLDAWAIYFMGAYGLGAMAWWLISHRHAGLWVCLLGVTVLLGLLVAFRERILLAAGIALLLWLSGRYPQIFQKLYSQTTAYFARISYSVFLVHFPVCLLVNALFMRWLSPTPAQALFGMLLAWLMSNAAGAVFERYVERRA